MPDNDKLERLDREMYGDKYATDPKERDGLKRRVEDMEEDVSGLKPIAPYLEVGITAIKWLGLPGLLLLAAALLRGAGII